MVHQDQDGYYFVLPDGTTRRMSVVISEAGASVVQTDIAKDASVEVSVRDIRGERVGGEPEDEIEHFITCPTCAELIDMRNLAQVFDHEERCRSLKGRA